MASYGSPSVKIEFDNAGGTLVDMSAYCVKDFSINRKANTIDSTPYGATWAQHIASGMKAMEPINFPIVYDDTATTGPEVIFYNAGAALGSTRTLKITYGGTQDDLRRVHHHGLRGADERRPVPRGRRVAPADGSGHRNVERDLGRGIAALADGAWHRCPRPGATVAGGTIPAAL